MNIEPNIQKNLPVILANVPVVIGPERSPQEWADRINAATEKEIEAILHKGRELIAAKKALLRHGLWEKLFKQHQHDADAPVRFSITTARMYMKVAVHPILSNPNLGFCLPPSLTALFQLTFIPDERLSQLIEAGLITPDLTKSHAEALRMVLLSALPFRMEVHKPLKPGQIRKPVINRQRSLASIIHSMEIAQAALSRYWSLVSEDLESGVLWIFTHPSAIPAQPLPAQPIPALHRCSCGHEHEDQRQTSQKQRGRAM